MTPRAVLFDLGNTLVGYYTSSEFPLVLRRCLHECSTELGLAEAPDRNDALFGHAMLLNREQPDYAVRPLAERLAELFGAYAAIDSWVLDSLVAAFLKPIFATARPNPQAVPILESLRASGIKTAIVSNTPWGSPAAAWRDELRRHGLLDRVDAAVFCVDVGWRKPHRAPFDRALALLEVPAGDALFVGDDARWDVIGAANAGLRPVLLDSKSNAASADHLTIRELSDILELTKADGAV